MSYKHFSNTKCEYYPCHGLKNQNCLFCFCPLYFVENCGGNPKYHKGVKDCSDCIANHDENSYEHVMKILNKIFNQINSTGKMPFVPIDDK